MKEKTIKKSALSPTVLIAGGAGFIGSHLAEKFIDQNTRVVVIDSFKTGKDIYVDSLKNKDKFLMFDANINDGIPEKIQSVDYVVHLAGVESYLYSRDQVNLDSLLTNALGTKNLLDFTQRSEAKFLLVSSTSVYEGLMSPLNLDQYFGHTIEEEKKYSLSEAKRFAEALVWEYYKKNDTDVRIARIPEIYGPRMNLTSSGNLGVFVKDVIENKSLVIKGEGTQKEYYLYITDAINGVVKSLLKKNTKGQIYTLTPKEPQTVLETAYLIKSLADSEIDIKFKPKQTSSTYKNPKIPDRSNLKNLGWSPKTSMKNGIKKTMDWFGYKSNENSFKPAKLIETARNEKEIKNGNKIKSIVNVIDEKKLNTENEKNKKTNLKERLIEKRAKKEERKQRKQRRKSEVKIKIKKSRKDKEDKKNENLTKKLGSIVNHISTSPPSVRPKKFKINSGMLENLHKQTLIIILGPIIALIFAVATPPALTYVQAKTGINNLEKTKNSILTNKPEDIPKYTEKAFKNFIRAQNSLSKSKILLKVFKKDGMYRLGSNLLSSLTYFSKGAYESSKTIKTFTLVWETLKPTSNKKLNQINFSETELALKKAKSSFQKAQAELKNVDTTLLPKKLDQKINLYKNYLSQINKHIGAMAILASEIPTLLGVENNTKTYLILFQNSNEIRPTGGFIGSYAVLKLKNGKIETLTIDDIYNPDGQIDVRKIETGTPLKGGVLLGEKKKYIRNANWNPDFTKSTDQIISLYETVSGDNIDGVIAVDLYFVKDLLKITGPIYLTAYGEEITADNLYERTQYHGGFNYENGSDQKKSFLTYLGSKLLENIFVLKEEKTPLFIKTIKNSLEERHLLISLKNSVLSAELEKLKWNGKLVDTNPNQTDYLQVVNANVGGTKSNYYVKQLMNYEILSKTRDGKLRAQLTLEYKHTGTENKWPGGPYKNYVRVLTQNGSNLTGANFKIYDISGNQVSQNIENTKESKKKSTNVNAEKNTQGSTPNLDGRNQGDIYKDVVINKVGKYTSYEYLINIKPQETGKLTLYYDLPDTLSITKTNKKYNLYWQKQAGTQNDLVNFNFEPPFGTKVSVGTKSFEDTFNTDMEFNLTIK